jgi:hypothetical protein
VTESDERSGGILTDIAQQIAGIFRYLLPGVVVVGFVVAAYPEIVHQVDTKTWPNFALASVVTLAVGNTWFLLNRYLVDQIVDYVLWLFKHHGPPRTGPWFTYTDDIARHIVNSVQALPALRPLHAHVHFRSSAVFMLWTIGEVCFLASWFHAPMSLVAAFPLQLRLVGACVFVAGIVQMSITRRVDYLIVNPPAD